MIGTKKTFSGKKQENVNMWICENVKMWKYVKWKEQSETRQENWGLRCEKKKTNEIKDEESENKG